MRKKHALLIGSSEYPRESKLQSLRFPLNDVDGLFKVLGDKSLAAFNTVIRLKNEPHHVVRRKIQLFLSRAAREDLVLIYFAGHGLLDSDMQLYLATTDTEKANLETTSIDCGEIRKLIGKSRAKSVVIFLDCCYSGAFGNAFRGGEVDEQLNILAGGGTGTFVFTASESLQVAKEVERDGHGIFTKYLIDGISGKAAEKKTGFVTIDGLISYVERMIALDSETSQRPQSFNLFRSGQLVISAPENDRDEIFVEEDKPHNDKSQNWKPKSDSEFNNMRQSSDKDPIDNSISAQKLIAAIVMSSLIAGILFYTIPPFDQLNMIVFNILFPLSAPIISLNIRHFKGAQMLVLLGFIGGIVYLVFETMML